MFHSRYHANGPRRSEKDNDGKTFEKKSRRARTFEWKEKLSDHTPPVQTSHTCMQAGVAAV